MPEISLSSAYRDYFLLWIGFTILFTRRINQIDNTQLLVRIPDEGSSLKSLHDMLIAQLMHQLAQRRLKIQTRLLFCFIPFFLRLELLLR